MLTSHGLFAGRSRHLARHDKPSKLGISKLINRFNVGDKVIIAPHGNFKNIPHPRYKGRVGTVMGARGAAYVIDIWLTKSTKRSLVVPQMYLERFSTVQKK